MERSGQMVGCGNFAFIFAVIPVGGVESGFSVDAALIE